MLSLKNAVTISRQIISQVVANKDIVVDATCGRGHDTLFLARLAGPEGAVYSFDIQEEAIASAQELVAVNHLAQQVKFIKDDHARLGSYIEHKIKAVIFNLGYLPGGNHQITTKAESTIKAVNEAQKLLEVGGVISIVAYPGHEAGKKELEELKEYLSQIPQKHFEIIEAAFINQINQPPKLFIAQKVKELI